MKIVKSSLNEIDILGKRQEACAIVWECINNKLEKNEPKIKILLKGENDVK
ncbi:hypothetical protein AOH328_15890 [Helicobacter pylori]|jgi:hypothetical protein